MSPQIISEFERPMEGGTYSATFSLSGAFLPAQRQYMEVTVVEGRPGLVHAHEAQRGHRLPLASPAGVEAY